VAINIDKKYRSKFAFAKIKGIIPNPVTGQQFPFDFECLVDTGFYGGFFVPNWFVSNAKSIGVNPYPTTITLADGTDIPALTCAAYLQQIEDYCFPSPGKLTFLVIYKKKCDEVMGMDALQYFSVLFDGPNQTFKLIL